MRDQLPGDEFKTTWQNQPTETSAMTLKLLRSKARELQAKTRRHLLGTLAGPVGTAFLFWFGIRAFPRFQPVLEPLFAFALVWSLVGFYFLNRGMRSAAMPGDAGVNTGLEFCRAEVERRRDLLRRVLLWSLAPLLLAIGTLIFALAEVGLRNGLPFVTLVGLWIVGYFVLRFREQRELDREIDELNDLARDNSR